MKRAITGLVLALVGLCLTVLTLRADVEKDRQVHANMVGTWRMATMKINGKENDLPQDSITYKHITPVGFVWLSFEKKTGKVFRSAGGTWTLKGDVYTEKIEYGVGGDFDVVNQTSPSFTLKLVGDKWSHTGDLANGTHLEEVWERVKPAEQEKAK